VGFAIGEDRLIDVLPAAFKERQKLQVRGAVVIRTILDSSQPAATAAAAGERGGPGPDPGLALAEELRREGVPAVSLGAAPPQRAYAYAEHLGSPAIVVLGEDELKKGELTVRTTATRQQATMARDAAFSYLKSFFVSSD
jgi:histidyl-tRNA synthetase